MDRPRGSVTKSANNLARLAMAREREGEKEGEREKERESTVPMETAGQR